VDLPPWASELRPHQAMAIEQTLEAYADGADVVFLSGPTGTGKTLIAKMIQQELEAQALYVCSSLTLQDQFAKDFPESRVLKGRSNYPTLMGGAGVTAADCTSTGAGACRWCPSKAKCPYQMAKKEAAKAELMVVNTAYFLTEANLVPDPITSGRELVIVDEADVLESELMNFATFEVSERTLKRLELDAPVKDARKPTLVAWFGTLIERCENAIAFLDPSDKRFWTLQDFRWYGLLNKIRRGAKDIAGQVEDERWVRDYPTGRRGEDFGFQMRPVVVHGVGPGQLWRHGDRWLCMSATLISSQEMAESLGLELQWAEVDVPMLFPVHNRPLYVAPVADMSNSGQAQGSYAQLIPAIVNVIGRYDRDDRVLIHSVNYKLTEQITNDLRRLLPDRRVVSYAKASERTKAKRDYERIPGAILVAPSMDRGVDFAGDLCRVQIVAKVPFPNVGDRLVSTRMHLPGGDTWYGVQTVRTLVQMTGRGVRSRTDWCDTWLLDEQFVSNILRKQRKLLPGWWKEALILDFNPRELKN